MKKKLETTIFYRPELDNVFEMKEGYCCVNGTEVLFMNMDNLGSLKDNNLRGNPIIISYDSFNPFILGSVLDETIKFTKKVNAILTVYKLPDTLKKVTESGFVKKTYDRSKHRKIQLRSMTYEFFMKKIMNHNLLKKILNKSYESNLIKKILNISYESDLIKKIDRKMLGILDIIPK